MEKLVDQDGLERPHTRGVVKACWSPAWGEGKSAGGRHPVSPKGNQQRFEN